MSIMTDLRTKATDYAVEKANELHTKAVAQAYTDGLEYLVLAERGRKL